MYCLLHCLFLLFDWGIRGAATATVCAQLIALVWQLHLFCRKDELIRLKKRDFSFETENRVGFIGYWYVSLLDEYGVLLYCDSD